MKILIFSPMGDGVGLAHQLVAEGHQVALHYRNEDDAEQGQGMLWSSDDWQQDARQADFTIFDNNGFGGYADNLRKDGVKVWCGGKLADELEHNRTFGQRVFAKAGIPAPETLEFKGGAEAKNIIEANFKPSERVVIKLNNASSASSYCSKDRADCLGEIESWEKHYAGALDHGGIIQRFVEGVEVSVEGWFDGEKFVYPFNWTMEDKKLLAGNLGPNVGCAFSMVRQMRAREPRIARKLLLPLTPMLKKAGYVGQVDVNAIVDDAGDPFALEFTPRPGYEGTSNLILALDGFGDSIGRCLGLGDGEGSDGFCGHSDAKFDYVAALRLWVPPYPYEAKTKPLGKEVYKSIEGTPVATELTPETGFVPYDVKLNDEGKMVLAGTCGVVGITLGSGRTPEEATMECLRRARQVEVPNLSYRIDAGERVSKDLPLVEHLLR